jgi:glycosyltransferase involved in cell wall biosynthesis
MTQTLPSTGLDGETGLPYGAAERLELVDPADAPGGEGPVVSVVIPYYNPGDRLRSTVEHLVHVLDDAGISFEIITVSDGSTDGSTHSLEGMPESTVRRVAYATNVGKGYALRTGLAMASGRYLGFIDADGDIPPEILASFVFAMRGEEADMIIGSKRHPDSSVHWTPLRRFYSWGHQALIRRLFSLDVKDTQVGIKLMRRQVVTEVLPLLRESRFALDLELLVLARRLGYTRILEAAVDIEERSSSTISVKRAGRLLADTLGVFVRLSIRRQYDAAIACGPSRGVPVASEGSIGSTMTPVTPSPILA